MEGAAGSGERTDGPVSKPGVPKLFSLPRMETAIGPLTLAITGMMFLAGWTERNTLLKKFGISASVVPESIQVTLARGYFPLLAGIAVVGLIIAAGWALSMRYRDTLARLSLARAASTGSDPTGPGERARFSGIAFAASGAMLMLLVGYVSGIVSANIKAHRAREIVAADCGRCFAYRLSGRTFIGRVLAQNDTRTVLLTGAGVVLFDTRDISSVRRPHPSPPT